MFKTKMPNVRLTAHGSAGAQLSWWGKYKDARASCGPWYRRLRQGVCECAIASELLRWPTAWLAGVRLRFVGLIASGRSIEISSGKERFSQSIILLCLLNLV